MNNHINELVNQIEVSFSQLNKAVEHIKSAEKLSTDVVSSSTVITDGFKSTIESLEKVVTEDFQKIYGSLAIKSDELISKIEGIDFQKNFDDISLELKETRVTIVDRIASKNFDAEFKNVKTDMDQLAVTVSSGIKTKNFDSDFKIIKEGLDVVKKEVNVKIESKNFNDDFKTINENLEDAKNSLVTSIQAKNFDANFKRNKADLLEVKGELIKKIAAKNFDTDFSKLARKISLLEEKNNEVMLKCIKQVRYNQILSLISIILIAVLAFKIYEKVLAKLI